MLSSADTIEKYKIWTFASDESGEFERTGLQPHHVTGGVLLPGTPEQSDVKLDAFSDWCHAEGLPWPPHATDLPLSEKERLRAKVAEQLAELGGLWLFVVANARDREEAGPSLALYLQMLTAATDLAGRIASLLGAKELHLRPASRTKPLPAEAVERGLAARSYEHPGQTRAMSEAEVRGTMDALRREPAGALPPYPKPATVRADSAKWNKVHAGVALADVGCNALYNGLSSGNALQAFEKQFQPAVVVTLRATDELRAIDRALRESPAELVPAAKLVAKLAADAAGAPRNEGDLRGLRASSSRCAELLWSSHVKSLAAVADAGACARSLLAHAEVELGGRSGSYEGLARALATAWSEESEQAPLARRQRLELRDRTLQARLWRATIDCANHRGDLATAQRAVAGVDAILRGGRSLMLLALEFQVRNLAVVSLQNELPVEAESAERLCAELASRTHALIAAADHAASLAATAPSSGAVPRGYPEEEQNLWKHACDTEPGFATPDLELGMAFGTIARSHAFLGRHDDALRAAMAARARFTDMAFELGVNAAVISRIELDRARCAPGDARKRAGLLEAALRLCGAEALARGKGLPDLQAQPAARFALDISLRALLWAPHVSFEAKPFLAQLARPEFVANLSRGALRSHPSELVARHAAELLRRHGVSTEAAGQLFRLSRTLCSEHPASSTLGRLGRFTAKLHEEPSFEHEGPAGSVLNPNFEYR
jgi:hypothetical protein